jgi:hypothetical protein
MKNLGLLTFFFATAIVEIFTFGWAASKLWGWFIVPIFGVPALGYVQACGVRFAVRFFVQSTKLKKEDKEDTREASEKLAEALIVALILPLMVVGMGKFLTLFL